MSDLPPLPPGFRLDQPDTEAVPAAGLPPLPPGFKLDEPAAIPPAAAEEPWLGRAALTAGVRGLGGLVAGLTDPLAPLRTLLSPDLARLEDAERRAATVPPPGEIARRVGNKVFEATIPEYEPTTPLGRVGMAAAQGAVGGGALGLGGALLRTGAALAPLAAGTALNASLGGLSGTTGQIASEATGGSERAAILGSLVPGGALTAAGLRAHSRITPEMEAAGVNPTLGQAMGGFLNRFEQGVGSIPWLGDFIKTGRAGAVEEFNRGAINNALGHIDEQLPPDTPLGRPAIDTAETLIGNRYDQITPLLNVTLDNQFGTGLTDIFRRATMLSHDHQQQFGNTFRTEVLDRLGGTSSLTGEAFRDAESTLGTMARENRYSPLPADRAYGRLVQDLQDELRGLQVRSNPAHAAELQNIHRAYAEMARVELAAARMGTGLGGASEHGVFTPSQLTSAVRQMDPTLRNRAFAAGRALLQPYAEGGRRLLGDTVPDSGTPYRSLAALGAGAAGTGALFDPLTMAGIGGVGLGLGALYSRQGRAALNYFLQRPGQSALTGLLAAPEQ
jgi:hypothetical protein